MSQFLIECFVIGGALDHGVAQVMPVLLALCLYFHFHGVTIVIR